MDCVARGLNPTRRFVRRMPSGLHASGARGRGFESHQPFCTVREWGCSSARQSAVWSRQLLVVVLENPGECPEELHF